MTTNKNGIRGIAIAESFRKEKNKSILSGIVMRKDLIIDGISFGNTTIGGDDATESIIGMYKSLQRNDINFLLLNGLIISMYNIIDGRIIHENIGIPVIAITFKKSQGIIHSIKKNFPSNYTNKLDLLNKIGNRNLVLLKTDKYLWIRTWGIELSEAVKLLNSFLIQGSIPEPIKIAKLISHAFLKVIDN